MEGTRGSDGDAINMRSVVPRFAQDEKRGGGGGGGGDGVSAVRPLMRLCFDFVVRHLPLCESLASLPLPILHELFALALRRHLVDRRLLRLAAASGLAKLSPTDIALGLGFTRNGVKAMRRLESATLLDLSGPVKAGDCRNLATLLQPAGMHFLRSLNLSHYPHRLTLDDMRAIAGLTGLESLDLSHTPITDEMLTEIAGMSQLTTLSLRHCRALRGEVPKLAEMNLTRLDVSRTKFNSLRYIAKITTLRSLDLSLTDIRSTERLSSARQLEELNLFNCANAYERSPLRELTNLRRLDIANTTGLSLFCLAGLTKLTHIDVSRAYIRDCDCIPQLIEQCPQLVNLSAEGMSRQPYLSMEAYDHLMDATRNRLVIKCHYASTASIIEALRQHRSDQCTVLTLLSLLKNKAHYSAEGVVARKRVVRDTLLRRKTLADYKRAQKTRIVPYNVNEDGIVIRHLGSALDAFASDLLDALYGLLEPYHLDLTVLNKILEILRYLSRSRTYASLLSEARWLNAFYNLLWILPQHDQTVLQTLRLVLDHVSKDLGNAYLANLGLQPLLAELIRLHPGDAGILGHALEIASRLSARSVVGLEKWLVHDRLIVLLRAMREHPREITIVDPALLILTLLENRGHGSALASAGALFALAQAGANYPATWNTAEWSRTSCAVVNTVTLLELLAPYGGVEMPEERDTLKRMQLLWMSLRDSEPKATSAAVVADKQEANRNRRQKRKANKFALRTARRLQTKPAADAAAAST